jgi:hypothetical protein
MLIIRVVLAAWSHRPSCKGVDLLDPLHPVVDRQEAFSAMDMLVVR